LLLNFPKEFAAARMSEIESFAELGEFFDRPVRLYSSGMRARLGFAMYACFRPDIFIVDEVLSVGDVFFRQKCATRMRQLMDEGMTMLFVSHDAQAVLNLCDEAILLQNGKLVFSGSPEEAIRRHHSSLSQPAKWEKRKPNAAVVAADKARVLSKEEKAIVRFDVLGPRRDHRHGTGEARIVGCRVTNSQNQDVASIHVGRQGDLPPADRGGSPDRSTERGDTALRPSQQSRVRVGDRSVTAQAACARSGTTDGRVSHADVRSERRTLHVRAFAHGALASRRGAGNLP
jgi:ABC-type glutathione transport system ATPase component